MPEEGCQIASKYDTSGGRVETHQRRSCPLYNKNWVQQASICTTAKSSSHNLSWQRWVQQPSICMIANLQVQKASIGMTAETSHNSSLTFEFSKQAFVQLQNIPQFITYLWVQQASKQAFAWLQNHPTICHWPCKGRKETWWWCKQVKLVQMHKLQDDTLEQSSSTIKTS